MTQDYDDTDAMLNEMMARGRDTQNSAVRTRDEQVALLSNDLAGIRCSALTDHQCALRHIAEAEARGAEEQHRKDAEGKEPIAWIFRTRVMGTSTWIEHTSATKVDPIPGMRCDIRPLYEDPTNVSALEAKVKELEAEKAARNKAREHNWFYLKEDPECGYSDVSDVLNDLCPLEMVEIAEAADVRTFWAFQGEDGETYEFNTEEEARAALTREGGV